MLPFLFRAKLPLPGSRALPASMQARLEDDVHGRTSAVSAGCTEAAVHGHPLQRGRLYGCSRLIRSGTSYLAPTVGALGTATLDENGV
ncbi:MAG: hypothetical protein O7D86_10170 [Proteobacteria bacterium]|nr:hypothetical protein [Pseudomonadota bacterium]